MPSSSVALADASGYRPARNPKYRDALELLLTRLKGLDAVLEEALVDSGHTRRIGLPEDKRRLTEGPLRLSDQPDMTELRKQLTRRQGPIGQRPGARPDGNTTKQIKLRLTVPGDGPSEASLLEALLASAIDQFEYQSVDEAEPEPGQTFPEGSVTRVTVNRYERDPVARKTCLARYGHRCTVCDVDFEAQYGDIGKDFDSRPPPEGTGHGRAGIRGRSACGSPTGLPELPRNAAQASPCIHPRGTTADASPITRRARVTTLGPVRALPPAIGLVAIRQATTGLRSAA